MVRQFLIDVVRMCDFLPFGMLSLSAISMMFIQSQLAVCMLVGMVV